MTTSSRSPLTSWSAGRQAQEQEEEWWQEQGEEWWHAQEGGWPKGGKRSWDEAWDEA